MLTTRTVVSTPPPQNVAIIWWYASPVAVAATRHCKTHHTTYLLPGLYENECRAPCCALSSMFVVECRGDDLSGSRTRADF